MGCGSSRVPGKIKLYYMPTSAPCRSVMLTAWALGIKLDLQLLNVMAGDHLKPDFLKINPQHCIPTLDDEGFTLWESRAICAYLVNNYGKDDLLYPKDPKKRAIVDARLDFDQGTLYQSFYNMFIEVFRGNTPDAEKVKKLHDSIEILEIYLKNTKWAAGEHITIADFVLIATMSTIEASDAVDMKKHVRIKEWMERCKNEMFGYKEANQSGIDSFKEMMKNAMKKKQEEKIDEVTETIEKLDQVVKAATDSD